MSSSFEGLYFKQNLGTSNFVHSAYDASSTSPPSASIRLSSSYKCSALRHGSCGATPKLRLDHGCQALFKVTRITRSIKYDNSYKFSAILATGNRYCSLNCPRPANNFPIQTHVSRKASDEKIGCVDWIAEARDQLVAIPQSLAFRQAFQTKLMQQNVRQRHKRMSAILQD
jgi:hypothetical protein